MKEAKIIEPHLNRNASSFTAFINIVCVVAGTGILGLPYALKLGGWITLVFFVICAGVSVYTGRLLIDCLYPNPKTGDAHRLLSYPDIGQCGFGRPGRLIVQIFHYTSLLSSACLYILLTGMNVYLLTKPYELGITLPIWTLIAGALIGIPTILLKTLKEVALLTFFAMFATFVVVLSVVVMGVVDLPNNLDQSHQFIDAAGFPMAIGTIAFSYSGNNIYPHIEATLRRPEHFKRTLLFAILTITVLYVATAVMGYLCYGDNIQSPVLNSLPDSWVKLTSIILITVHVAFAVPIYVCSFSLELEEKLGIMTPQLTKKKEFIYRVINRLITMAFITIVAMYIPYFTDFMALTGSITTSTLVFILPIVFHYKIFGWKRRKYYMYALDLLVLCIGFFALILGTNQSISSLVSDFKGEKIMEEKFA